MSAGVVSTMPPPARRSGQKRQREQTLLDEDAWTDRIEAIIQRDFFPDLPKLQNKLEWLQVSMLSYLEYSTQVTVPVVMRFIPFCSVRSLCSLELLEITCSGTQDGTETHTAAGCQEWGSISAAAGTVEHSTKASWH